MQLGLINSWRKMELTNGSQPIAGEKLDGQFMQMINALKIKPQLSDLNQEDAASKEGIHQLLTILSSSSAVPHSNVENDSINNAVTADEQISLNLDHLLTTYHHFSDGGDIPNLNAPNMDSILAETYANLENTITQALKKETNTEIAPDMFNQTELPCLLTDLKLLENTVEQLPDNSVKEKIAETVQELSGLMLSLNKVFELTSSSTGTKAEEAGYTKAGHSFTNDSNFIVGYYKLSSAKKENKQQSTEVNEQNLGANPVREKGPMPIMLTNPEQTPGLKVEASSQELKTAMIPVMKSEMNASEKLIVLQGDKTNGKQTSSLNEQTVEQWDSSSQAGHKFASHSPEGNQLSQSDGEQDNVGINPKGFRLAVEDRPIEAISEEIIPPTVERKTNDKSSPLREFGMVDIQGAEENGQTVSVFPNKNELEKESSFSSVNGMGVIYKDTTTSSNGSNSKITINSLSASDIGIADNRIEENSLRMARNPITEMESPKENSLSQENSSIESMQEETATALKEAELMVSKENREIPKRYSAVDSKLLAMQNRALQENRNAVVKETDPKRQKLDVSEKIGTGATTELKSIISSILSKVDKQLEGKNTAVVQKMINPIMVSSLRKSGELFVPTAGIKETAEVSQGDENTNVLPTVQNAFIKQHPLMLLTDSGEMAQPKNVEEQFAKLLANSTFTKVGDMQKLSIRLAPDHLGSIRIEITQNEGNMIARIITTTAEAKETLDKQLTSLKHGFAAQNLQVDKLDIIVSSQPQEKLQKEQQQQQGQQQSPSQRDKNDADEDENKQKTSFFEELLNMEV